MTDRQQIETLQPGTMIIRADKQSWWGKSVWYGVVLNPPLVYPAHVKVKVFTIVLNEEKQPVCKIQMWLWTANSTATLDTSNSLDEWLVWERGEHIHVAQ